MKTITKYLMMMIAMMAMCVSFSSCGNDDDDEPIVEPLEEGVVGRWSDSSGSLILYFDKNGTGTWTSTAKDSNGNSATYNYNFVYTYNENTNYLKISINGASVINNYEVSLTGNTMMLTFYQNSKKYSYVLTR